MIKIDKDDIYNTNDETDKECVVKDVKKFLILYLYNYNDI